MSHDEQRVRTMAGWVGVEISRSRVRTAGKAGYGLYRVRRMPQSIDLPEDLDEMWTPYAFTLEQIRAEVELAISVGIPEGPADLWLLLPGGSRVGVTTRWMSAYRGRRDLGVERDAANLPIPVAIRPEAVEEIQAVAELMRRGLLMMEHEADCLCSGADRFTNACVVKTTADDAVRAMVGRMARILRMARTENGTGFAPGVSPICGCVNRIDGGPPALHLCLRCGFVGSERVHSDCPGCRETARRRQRAHNAEFQAEHLKRRAFGLEARHAAKLARGVRNDGELGPRAR